MKSLAPYRTLSAERRLALVTQAMTRDPETRARLARRLVAKGGGFRLVTLMSWPVDKLARQVVRVNAETGEDQLDLLHLLYVELEPAIQITFLDAAGVAHVNGKIEEQLRPPFAEAPAVARGAKAVHAQHGDDGDRYLDTLVRYNLVSWPGLDDAVAELDSV